MSSAEINLISLLMAAVFIVVIAVYFLWFRRTGSSSDVKDWIKRLNLGSPSAIKSEEATALSLLKDKDIQESFFTSKIQRVHGFREWILHSGLTISPWLLLGLSGALAGCVFITLYLILHLNTIFAFITSMLVAGFSPWAVITFLTAKRKSAFLVELPIALDMIRRAVRAGHSVDRALEMVSEQMPGLIGSVFGEIVDRVRLGEPVEEVLSQLSNRLGIDAFHMLSIVLVLQRETGGSLAEAIDNFAKVIRSRQNIAKKVKALTGEARASAVIITAIPIFIFSAVYITSPTYLDPLFYTEAGNKLLILGGVLLFTGVSMIIKMVFKDVY